MTNVENSLTVPSDDASDDAAVLIGDSCGVSMRRC